ncbi:hypothetical protein KR009_002875 [Drosophila setifemur]|nr:hypothetical protein KR009_002875 [Drosophila setifemur]
MDANCISWTRKPRRGRSSCRIVISDDEVASSEANTSTRFSKGSPPSGFPKTNLENSLVALEADRLEHKRYVSLVQSLGNDQPGYSPSALSILHNEKIAPNEPPVVTWKFLDDSWTPNPPKPKEAETEAVEKELLPATSNSSVTITISDPSVEILSPERSDEHKPGLNSILAKRISQCPYCKDDFINKIKSKSERLRRRIEYFEDVALQKAKDAQAARMVYEESLFRGNLLYSKTRETYVPRSELPQLTAEQDSLFRKLISGPDSEVLVTKFHLDIKRSDIHTLLGSNWLNDEVINFYMNLIAERSQQRMTLLPKVYAMSTFFLPRLLDKGYDGMSRWTRNVDLFSKDIILVPVHVNKVHWGMAIVHMRDRSIRYYDSLGHCNDLVLVALVEYMQKESLDKRRRCFHHSGFLIENVPVSRIPQQTNGSDCGVFSCMYAEYIARDKPITFSQKNMNYFRQKMVLEICAGQLWS